MKNGRDGRIRQANTKRRFYTKRLGGHKGHDRPGDWFGVFMDGFDPADTNKGPKTTVLVTAVASSDPLEGRARAQRLTRMLNAVWWAHENDRGVEIIDRVYETLVYPNEEVA